MKKILKVSGKYISIYIILIITFVALLTTVCIIPRSSIEENVQESAETLTKQTNRLYILIRNFYVLFDNFTDALIINNAYSIDTEEPFYSAMLGRRNYIDEETTKIIHQDEPGELKFASKYEALDQVGELNDTLNKDIEESFEYARYWHGYLVLFRPLLVLLNISQIRTLMTIVFVGLLIALFGIITKKVNLLSAIAVILGIIGVDYLYIGLTCQSTPIFLLTMIISVIIALKRDTIKNINLLFFIVGAIACYIDFLTVPLISLGLPLIVYFLRIQKERHLCYKETLKIVILASINWGAGYLLFWISKWIIVDLVMRKRFNKNRY